MTPEPIVEMQLYRELAVAVEARFQGHTREDSGAKSSMWTVELLPCLALNVLQVTILHVSVEELNVALLVKQTL
jgi:hypothetical protein